MRKKNQPDNGIDRFESKHPVIIHSLLILLAFVIAGFVALLFIDVFTSHGQEVKVPDVRNLTLDQAIEKLEDAGLKWEISDSSTYSKTFKPGTVLSQDPQPGHYIKAIRPIFLKINAMHERHVSFPKLTEISGRQGMAMLMSMGFKNVVMDSTASPYDGLILEVKVDGRNVAPGASVAIDAQVRITVGDGSIQDLVPEEFFDSRTSDSIQESTYQSELEEYKKNNKDKTD